MIRRPLTMALTVTLLVACSGRLRPGPYCSARSRASCASQQLAEDIARHSHSRSIRVKSRPLPEALFKVENPGRVPHVVEFVSEGELRHQWHTHERGAFALIGMRLYKADYTYTLPLGPGNLRVTAVDLEGRQVLWAAAVAMKACTAPLGDGRADCSVKLVPRPPNELLVHLCQDGRMETQRLDMTNGREMGR